MARKKTDGALRSHRLQAQRGKLAQYIAQLEANMETLGITGESPVLFRLTRDGAEAQTGESMLAELDREISELGRAS